LLCRLKPGRLENCEICLTRFDAPQARTAPDGERASAAELDLFVEARLSQRAARPQGRECLELGRFAPVSSTPIATLIAFIEEFDPLEFLGAFFKRDPRIAKLCLKLVD
jgi:hypothetical protein